MIAKTNRLNESEATSWKVAVNSLTPSLLARKAKGIGSITIYFRLAIYFGTMWFSDQLGIRNQKWERAYC